MCRYLRTKYIDIDTKVYRFFIQLCVNVTSYLICRKKNSPARDISYNNTVSREAKKKNPRICVKYTSKRGCHIVEKIAYVNLSLPRIRRVAFKANGMQYVKRYCYYFVANGARIIRAYNDEGCIAAAYFGEYYTVRGVT